MTNEQVRAVMEQRTRLEYKIHNLGGKLPPPWPWDYDGTARNLQLLEIVEQLENPKLRSHIVGNPTP